MNAAAGAAPQLYRLPIVAWLLAVVGMAAGYVAFRAGVDLSALQLWTRPEYSHGLVIPFIAAFLVWQHRDWLERTAFPGSWLGLVFIVLAFALNAVGRLGGLFIQQYAALFALYGLVLSLVGAQVFRRLWVPLLILLFMISLPEFLYQSLSSQLQLLSSRAGVWVIRLFGISVYVEGNVIDLGAMQLQVAEACSGLRYLFPLMTLGFIVAYFFKSAFWKRLIVFLSSIPITIAMNSLRIGLIGVTVEYWGPRMAEGLLHDFEGWVVFMASGAVMLFEVVLLARIGKDRRPWRQVFGVELPPPVPQGARFVDRGLPRSYVACVVFLLVGALAAQLLPERRDAVPGRRQLVDFPLSIAGRSGEREVVDPASLAILNLDDYLLAEFGPASDGDVPVDLWVAWYDSQRAERTTHSPSVCLPAGGWTVRQFSQFEVPGERVSGHPLRVNRAVISRGDARQLVYYFFKQRDRVVTGEYAVKWYLFWDGLTRNRTDGALIRFVTPILSTEDERAADHRLAEFVGAALRQLEPYVPD
ncbi:MAG: VPLPA-CTERM-specific exosortase XrtD [Steroidobacteraceae bacterium]